MNCCQLPALLGLEPDAWANLSIGSVLGLLVTVLFQWLGSLRQRWLLKRAYAGTWLRVDMSEYGYKPEDWKRINPQVLGKEIVISISSAKSIHLRVDYSTGRGITEAVIELHGDGMTSGEGPYAYSQEGDACHGHAGWYSLHRLSEGRLYVYFTGQYPENTAAGYEVWERK